MRLVRDVFAIGLLVSPAILLLATGGASGQSTGSASLLPPAQVQFSDANGAPLAGGTVKTCVPGVACGTLKPTWADSGMAQPNSNPLVLDAAGRATIYGAGSYYEEVRDQFGNLVLAGATSAVNGQLLAAAPAASILANPAGSPGPVQAVSVLPPLALTNAGLGLSYGVVVDSGNQIVDSSFSQTLRLANNGLIYSLPPTSSVGSGFDFRIYNNFGGTDTVTPSGLDSFLGLAAGQPLSLPVGSSVRITAGGGVWVAAFSPGASSPKFAAGQVVQMRMTGGCPPGTLQEDGTAVSRTTFAALFGALGTTWGAGDGSTTFNLPNAGGKFNRGWEPAQTVDSGRVFASPQLDQLQEHEHNFTDNTVQVVNGISGGASGKAQAITVTNETTSIDTAGPVGNPARVGAETRPVNITALSCVGTGLAQ